MRDVLQTVPRKALFASVLLGLLMVSTSVLTKVVTPTVKMSEGKPALDLTALVPSEFGQWHEDRNAAAAVVNPETEAAIAKIYTQTLARTYVNAAGDRVLLSVAYGDDQRGEATQAHRPEICYTAQGFAITRNDVGVLKAAQRNIPVRRLVAVSGSRNEPITYWVTVGDRATLPGVGRKLLQLFYGLGGKVPDGLLFRVSTIQPDRAAAYALQDQFVNALFDHIGKAPTEKLAGKFDD
ncbi:exosortase-associated protein EpsI, B-type [Janthinobacterium sp.]|uniref:exosortase-associated protein EpsI, B-type n=1 Tax=Janthinobacterium sp. TaxID=1871054 RepID=UPI00260ED1A3|nr:exosortase-associated protein EpsI, B-type [Janthinobacterium sp.]